MDSKFDDGLPYSGDIVGAVNLTDWNSAANISCHSNNAATTVVSTITSVLYATTNNVSSGCLAVFNIRTNQLV